MTRRRVIQRVVSSSAVAAPQRRRASEYPWWVQVGVKFGVPTLAAGWLLYHQTVIQEQQTKDLIAAHNADQVALRQLTDAVKEADAKRKVEADGLTNLMWLISGTSQRVCINTAKTDSDRIACASIARLPQ